MAPGAWPTGRARSLRHVHTLRTPNRGDTRSPSTINPASLSFFGVASSEIGRDRLRYGQSGRTWKEGVRIVGADHLRQRAFRCARQLRNALDRNLAHCRLVLPEALDGAPRRGKSTRVLDVKVRLQ